MKFLKSFFIERNGLLWVILSFGFFLTSCVFEKNQEPQIELVINQVDDLYIPMDAETTPSRNIYQVMESDTTSFLVFFNPLNYNIYIYDLSTRQLVSRTQFEKEGPDGLGDMISYFQLVNDSTLAFHSYYRAELIYANMSGEVITRYKLRTKDFSYTPFSYRDRPFIIIDAEAYFYSGDISSGGEVIRDLPMVLKYDLNDSSKSDTGIRLAQFYQTSKEVHFPGDLSQAYLGANSQDKLLVVSFPLDDSVRVIRPDGEIQAKYLGVEGHEVKKPLKNRYDAPNPRDQMKDIFRFSSYSSVRYDPFRDLYLRTHYSATPDALLEEGRFTMKWQTVVADGDLNVIGVANAFGVDNVLFTREGILELTFVQTQEDSLWVRVYEYAF